MADVKFSEFVSGGQLETGDIVVGLRGGVNTQFASPADPSGPFMLKAANGSDAANKTTFVQNLGLGQQSSRLVLTDADFAAGGGTYTLTNPPPTIIFMQADIGGRILQLPPQNEATSLQASESIEIITNLASDIIEIDNAAGVPLFLAHPGTSWYAIPDDRSTLGGAWIFNGTVQTIQAGDRSQLELTGSILLKSSDGSINISNNEVDIDFTLGASADGTLQSAYDNGDGEILLSTSKPFSVLNGSSTSEVNGVTTPSTGLNTVANYRVLGWTFTPAIDMTVTALQYDDALFTTAETRETGIYVKGTGELLGKIFIAQTDPLDPSTIYRTKTLDAPIELTGGVDYVYATVVPAGQSDHTNADAVPDANVVISQRAELPSDVSLIPLSFPQSFTTVANFVHVGSFEYISTTIADSFSINDPTTSSSTLLEVVSTTKGSIPAPRMGTAARDAIVSPVAGLTIINTDDSPIRYNVFDGAAWQEIAYITEIPSIPPAFGEMYFQDNATPTVIAAINTPVKVNATYNSGILSGFTQGTGTLTYTDVNSRTVLVTCDLTATYPGTSNNTSFYIVQNGTPVAKSKQSSYIGAVTPANEPNPVQCLLSLVSNDTIEIWVENNTNGDDITVTDLNLTVITLSGIADASIILEGENYLSLSGDTLTANPVNLATTNVTGQLPLANIANIGSQTVLGSDAGGIPTALNVLGGLGIAFGNLFSTVTAGNAFPTISPDTNVSASALDGQLFYITNMASSGGIVTVTVNFTFTATNFDCAIRVPYPSIPGGTSVNFVNVVGNITNAVTPTTADGVVLGATPAATYFVVNMHVISATSYKGRITAQYQLV